MKKVILLFMALTLAIGGVSAKKAKAKHVVLLGIDGWGSYSVAKAHDIPNIKMLMANGCYTLKNRTVLPSVSAVNWTSMFCGVCTEMHGFTDNLEKPEFQPSYVNERGVSPSIYSLFAAQRPNAETGFIYEWGGLNYLIDTLAIKHREQAKGNKADNKIITDMATRYIKEKKPTFVSVCFDQLDHAGHSVGHDTPGYYDELANIDMRIGQIIQALKDAGMYDNTIIIVTSDHGGIGTGHGGKTMEEMMIPFVICGKGVKKAGEIKDVVMQFDTAATIAEIFGLKRPQSWRGVPIYSVFK